MVYVFFTRFGILLVFLYSLLASFLWYCHCYCCFIFGFVMVDSFSLCSPVSANVIGCAVCQQCAWHSDAQAIFTT